MGGLGGEIRATDRQKLWDKFCNQVRPFVTHQLGLIEQTPLTEQKAYQSMRMDPESDEWVLDYYFSR
jgi:hypothetical protein